MARENFVEKRVDNKNVKNKILLTALESGVSIINETTKTVSSV